MPISPSFRRGPALLAACGIMFAAVATIPSVTGVAGAATSSQPNRPASDIEQDGLRKPGLMMRFAGIKRGQTVVEILPGAGYFTRVFSNAVGPSGKVFAATLKDSEDLNALSREPGHFSCHRVFGMDNQARKRIKRPDALQKAALERCVVDENTCVDPERMMARPPDRGCVGVMDAGKGHPGIPIGEFAICTD